MAATSQSSFAGPRVKAAGLPALAADLAGQPVSVIVSSAGIGADRAAKAASASIPIVFVMGGDPIKFGLVARFKPGGNLTGVSFLLNVLAAKLVRLLDLSPLPVKDGERGAQVCDTAASNSTGTRCSSHTEVWATPSRAFSASAAAWVELGSSGRSVVGVRSA